MSNGGKHKLCYERRMNKRQILYFAALAIASCGPAEDTGNLSEITTACSEVPDGAITAAAAWVRPAPAGRATSAAYLTLCNKTDAPLALTGIDAAIAEAAELHQTTRSPDGVTSMAPLQRLTIPPGETAMLQPGGAHIMLIGLNQPIAPGARVPLTLIFDDGARQTIEALAREADGQDHQDHTMGDPDGKDDMSSKDGHDHKGH